MPEPTTSATDAAPAAVEDQPIRERVKELTSQVLQQGRVDPEAVREVASAVLGRTPGSTAVIGAKAREFFAEAVRQLDDALVKSASATHGALQQLASRGQDFTDNGDAYIGTVIEVKHMGVMSTGGHRHPQYGRTRLDKSPEACVWV
jgi:hypothetical protein